MIPVRTIIRAAVTRFIPGVLAFLFGGLVFTARMKGITLEAPQIDGFTALIFFLTCGYVVGLALLRPNLERSAGVEGRRSVLAGFGATCVLLGIGVVHGSPTPHVLSDVFAFGSGALTALVLFAPWASRPALVAALPEVDMLGQASAHVPRPNAVRDWTRHLRLDRVR